MNSLDEMHNDPGYQQLVQELALQCKCTPLESRPCDGLLAGGLCDNLHPDAIIEDCDGDEL
jgi:hypothetical protein